MAEKAACLSGPLGGTGSAAAVHCPGVGPAPPGAGIRARETVSATSGTTSDPQVLPDRE